MSNIIQFPISREEKEYNKTISDACQDVRDDIYKVLSNNSHKLKKAVSDLSYLGKDNLEMHAIINSAGVRYLLTLNFQKV